MVVMKKQKTINMDICRLLAAFMIVAIHVYPFENISPQLDYFFTRVIFRIAVPFFLMLTGYFLIPKMLKDKQMLIKYTKKIVKLYLISMLIYLPINIYMGYFQQFNLFNFIKDILFDGTFYHLWYFPALLLGLWLNYIIFTKGKQKIIFPLILLLFLIGLLGDSYYGFISKISVLRSFYDCLFYFFDYTRNGFFYTPIFLYIGYAIYSTDRILSAKKKIFLLLVNLILMGIEGMLLYQFKIPRHTSMYFFLIPTAYFLFSFLREREWKRNKKVCHMATWLYILHPLFIVFIRFLFKHFHLQMIIENSLIYYFIVILSTLVFICIIEEIIKLSSLFMTFGDKAVNK